MGRQDRERQQQQMEADWRQQQRERQEVAPKKIPLQDQCPARFGGAHDYSMKGTDGKRRCWYCVKERPEAR